MPKETITLKFIGKKPSIGFIPGKEYRFTVTTSNGYIYLDTIPYTLHGLLKNWMLIDDGRPEKTEANSGRFGRFVRRVRRLKF